MLTSIISVSITKLENGKFKGDAIKIQMFFKVTGRKA